MFEIISGLQDGEQVVTVGQASLKQDSRVNVINQAGNAERAADANQEGGGQESDDAATD